LKYTVVRTPEAERELAEIWSSTSDRELIANAANLLDRDLAKCPEDTGESRPNGQRIAHCLPLGIRYRIEEDNRSVRVLAVWQCRRIGNQYQ
jgi:hypothetical protein